MSEIEFTEADRKILVKVYVSLDRIVKEERAIADAFNDLSGDVHALEQRIKAMERRLNHKSMDSPGESIKIDGESSKNGGSE